ncbi:hypothetical protein ABBQ38_000763 [Trebouxia sp. C0009 RCD-2024]
MRGRNSSCNCSCVLPWIGALCISALLTFVFTFCKLNGVPAPPEQTLQALPISAVLQTCNWGDTHRHNLIVAVIGDTSMHTRWLEDADDANWDLAVIYYGSLPHKFTCAKCMHVELGKGAKWKLVYQFTQSGAFAEHYMHRYTQVYVPDDDIIQLAASINELFNIQETYGLELAQPSLCSSVESHTIHVNDLPLWKQATTVLRYGTFVEIMVPLFGMRFFKTDVIKTLSTSASGYGLDWIWPFLLKYADNKIAVIDEVCVIHPRQSLQELGKMSMYDTNPSLKGWELQEEKAQFRKFGYSARRIRHRYKVGYQVKKSLGQVWQPWYADLQQARNQTGMISAQKGTQDQKKLHTAGMHTGSLLREWPEWTWTQLPVHQVG